MRSIHAPDELLPAAQALAKKMATSWANFARTGRPAQSNLQWMAADPANMQTMILDNDCRMVRDPQGDVRRILL